ncbi:terminase large subunit [Sphingomonas colocasiae]|uniref:Terminase large subunit n=1 Tax=Sphingomonas colocasiae TaxID=1848973 RepID=A0ABS7PY91_9SPHN|nr:terminase TerL endonuclease subunit [Sphingomonas colocasiae]MBY8826111.1 terminase large subunit [Sphingomonas colocasiae]
MNPWSTACLDWEQRLTEGTSLVPTLPLFKEEAARALRVFKRLRIPDVIGKPRMADACGPWFFPIVEALLGSYDPETNRRMIQELFLLIPKGNSKSSTGGALMLTATIVNRRPEAEFNIIAPTIQVANIAFKQAMNTILSDPELEKLFQIQRHVRTITHRTLGTQLQIKAADTDVVTGGKPVGTLIDETHVFAKKANAADIFVELRGALAKRPDGFLIQTTTQSKDPPSGVFKTELANARDVRDGKIDLPLLPILYEFPEKVLEGHLWKERRYWPMVNPNLGRSVDEPFLERELRKAERDGAEQLLLIASQHFNVEIGLRLRSDGWRGADYWEGAADRELSLDQLLARCEVVVAGVDGGGLDDLFALCIAGRERDTNKWLYWVRAWVQPEVIGLRPEIAELLRDFVDDGDLIECKHVEQDIEEIAAIIERVNDMGLFPDKAAIGLDPQGVGVLVDALDGIGITEEQRVAIGQGYRLSSAVWSLERKLKDKVAVHGGQPLAAWCVGNAKAEQRGNAVVIDKQVAGKAKIDPLIAIFNATKLLERNPEAAGIIDGELMIL